jgi:hypothetical protein
MLGDRALLLSEGLSIKSLIDLLPSCSEIQL